MQSSCCCIEHMVSNSRSVIGAFTQASELAWASLSYRLCAVRPALDTGLSPPTISQVGEIPDKIRQVSYVSTSLNCVVSVCCQGEKGQRKVSLGGAPLKKLRHSAGLVLGWPRIDRVRLTK